MSNSVDLGSLLGDTGADADATSAMMLTADNLGPAIMAGLGDVSLDDVSSSEVVLVTLLLDNSSSIEDVPGNADAIRVGHGLVVEGLEGSKQSADVLMSCRFLNDIPPAVSGVLYPYRPLAGVPKLDRNNYAPYGSTPLYDQAAVTLTGVTAKMAEFEQGGVSVRAITVILTDGGNNTSRLHDANSVKKIIEGLLRTEQHIIAGVGVDDGYTDFRSVFAGMGVQDKWILTPGNTPAEIRKAFAVISQSAVQASQSAGNFSQTAMGGFGA